MKILAWGSGIKRLGAIKVIVGQTLKWFISYDYIRACSISAEIRMECFQTFPGKICNSTHAIIGKLIFAVQMTPSDPDDPCSKYPSPCGKHGTCETNAGAFNCMCDVGWGGRNCGRQLTRCDQVAAQIQQPVCLNGGKCQATPDGSDYSCVCPQNTTGPRCETINVMG